MKLSDKDRLLRLKEMWKASGSLRPHNIAWLFEAFEQTINDLYGLEEHHKLTHEIIDDARGQSPENGKALLYNMDVLKTQLKEAWDSMNATLRGEDTPLSRSLKHRFGVQDLVEERLSYKQVLEELCDLKIRKDTIGKDEEYAARKAIAWNRAFDLLKSDIPY